MQDCLKINAKKAVSLLRIISTHQDTPPQIADALSFLELATENIREKIMDKTIK